MVVLECWMVAVATAKLIQFVPVVWPAGNAPYGDGHVTAGNDIDAHVTYSSNTRTYVHYFH